MNEWFLPPDWTLTDGSAEILPSGAASLLPVCAYNTLQTSVVQLKKIIVVTIVMCNGYISHYMMSIRNRRS